MELSGFTSFNIGILVYFAGVRLNRRIEVLDRYNIPEPVSGGLLVATANLLAYLIFNIEISFTLEARDFLLLYFFTGIGLNARFSDLVKGGRPLLILIVLTVIFMTVQNLSGIAVAKLFDLPSAFGLIGGTVSLVGGHGTAIAWAPTIAENHGVASAVELGAATATLGLIVASLVGGPIARHLILVRGAKPGPEAAQTPTVGLDMETEPTTKINHTSLMLAILVLNIAIALGLVLNEALSAIGLEFPAFVTCLVCGILLSNSVPHAFPKISWPARTRSMAVISEIALGVFLSMSLMSLQLWTIAALAAPMLVILALQVVITVAFIVFILFPVMGGDYEAAVLGAGFGGFGLGATPTAIANMTAVTKHYGDAPRAFLILPLVSAFFVSLVNAFMISTLLQIFP